MVLYAFGLCSVVVTLTLTVDLSVLVVACQQCEMIRVKDAFGFLVASKAGREGRARGGGGRGGSKCRRMTCPLYSLSFLSTPPPPPPHPILCLGTGHWDLRLLSPFRPRTISTLQALVQRGIGTAQSCESNKWG